MSGDPLDRALDSAGRSLRGASGLARLTAGIAAAIAVFAVAAWLQRFAWSAGPVGVLGAWLLGLVVIAFGFAAARRAIRTLGPWHIAALLEHAGAWRLGALTTVLEAPAAGTSSELHRAAAASEAGEVETRAAAVLRPAIDVQVRRTRNAAGLAAGALLALIAAGPLSSTAVRLWSPLSAFRALVTPVRLTAREERVARGMAVTLDLVAYGQRRAILLTRTPGESWQRHEVELDDVGRASWVSPPLGAEIVARLEAGGRRSAEVHVGVRLPSFLGAFSVTAHYPAYLKLEDEPLPTGGDTLVIPEGTRLTLTGRATTPLFAVSIRGPRSEATLTIAEASFHGELVPIGTGDWHLLARTADGSVLEGEPPLLPIRVLPDSAPLVEVPVPGADTIAPPSMQLTLVVSARDDHGLRSLHLEARRGARGPITRLPLEADGGERALVTTALDLGALGAKPGDTVHYAAVALDNAPSGHVARSREFHIRIPTEREQRAARADATAETSAGLDSVAAAAKRAQRQTDDLARERQRADGKGTGDGEREPMSRDAARKAEAAAQAQEKVIDQTKQLARQVEELQKAAEREGLADSALARQLGEIQQLLDKAMTPELRAKLAALREAVKDLDADRTRDALLDLARKQAELKDALEQARELFKRAALETDLANLAQEAKQLTQEQAKTTDKLDNADSSRVAGKQEAALASRVDSLAAALERAAQKVPSETTKQGLRQVSDRAKQASNTMQSAAKSAQQGKPQEAAQQGKEAKSQMDPLEQEISEERKQMQQEMRKEVLEAIERTLSETTRLAQRQVALAEAFRRGALVSQSRIDQGTVEEGAGKLMQQVTALAAKNALISPRAGIALAVAREAMRAAVEAVSSASPNLRDAADQAAQATDALAVAAFNLLRAKEQVSGSQSGSGLQEAMEQMQQMAGKQGQLSEQANAMMTQQSPSGAQQMMQMAMQQRAISQQLDRMRAGGQMPGAGELAREAKDVARQLETGRLTQETATRQARLFKKMLDAGRSLQGEEKDDTKERQSTTAKDGSARTPDLLDPRLRRDGELRLPGWEALQRLSPEERRRVMDYFRRLAGGTQ